MKKLLLLTAAFALTTHCCLAAASSHELELLDGWLYALHKPNDDISLQVDVAKFASARTVALSIMQAGQVSSLLEVKQNHIFINGNIAYGPISMRVAGGCPEGSLNRAAYEYAPAHRYFIFRRNVTDPAGDTTDVLQKCDDLASVMRACRSSSDAVLAVDLRVWLNIAFTELEKKGLPVRKILERVPFCTLTFARYEPVFLTQEEFERYLCASMSKCTLQ